MKEWIEIQENQNIFKTRDLQPDANDSKFYVLSLGKISCQSH